MSVDLSRAKRIAWATWTSRVVLASRESPREAFKSEDTGNIYSQSHMEDFVGVRVIEEFPPLPFLEELVGDAPAFLAEDTNGVLWSFSRFGDAGSGHFVPSRVSPSRGVDRIPFEEDRGYWAREIANKIDLSTVVPLFPRD